MSALREARRAQGYTLAKVAGRAGCSVGFLCDVEQGKKTANVATLARIVAALDVVDTGQDAWWAATVIARAGAVTDGQRLALARAACEALPIEYSYQANTFLDALDDAASLEEAAA